MTKRKHKIKWGFGKRCASEDLVQKYMPKVQKETQKLLRRYWNVDKEELENGGMQILRWMIPLCKRRRQLTAFVARWLPVYLEREAQWLTGKDEPWDMRTDECLEARYLCDQTEETLVEEAELRVLLSHYLTPGEYELVILLWQGHTQAEAAEILGISRQTLWKRLRRIRYILQPVFYPPEIYCEALAA